MGGLSGPYQFLTPAKAVLSFSWFVRFRTKNLSQSLASLKVRPYISAVKETALKFLMADGAAAYTFRPGLSPEQYAELHRLVANEESTENLRKALEGFAAKWNLQLIVDGV